MDVTSFFGRFFSREDYERIGTALSTAYRACDDLMTSSTVLSEFPPGMQVRGHLITPFVEHALTLVPGLTYELSVNEARNHRHVRYFKHTPHHGELALTSHFLGENPETARSGARSALNRAILAERNLDLFADTEGAATLPTHSYAWILHAGSASPREAYLALPSSSQRPQAVMSLDLPEAEPSDVENIREQVTLSLRSQEQKNEQDTG